MSVAVPSETEDGGAGVFGQVMGLVATTLGVFTLGAYLGRHLAGGPSLICFLIGFGGIFGLNYARGSGGAGDRPARCRGAVLGARVLFLLLLALIVHGLISLFVSMPAGNVVYAVLGLGIFGGYTLLDFNRLRNAANGDAVSIATGIFVDVLNVFTFFLQLFGRGRD